MAVASRWAFVGDRRPDRVSVREMLLQKLCEYSHRLKIPPPMYNKAKVRWILDLDLGGNLLDFTSSSSDSRPMKDRGMQFYTPHVGRSSGVVPRLLADNGEYVLGIGRPKSKPARVAKCHREFVKLVRACAESTGEAIVTAVLHFFENCGEQKVVLPEAFDAADIVTFRVEGLLPVDLDSVRSFWASTNAGPSPKGMLEKSASALAQCLICGCPRQAVKRLAFRIKRIPGGQSSGTALISAGVSAFESYGREASLNAPTCRECGERFSKALNSLIECPTTHITIDPLIFVIWTHEEGCLDVVSVFEHPESDMVKALTIGGCSSGVELDASPLYAAALSANGARAVVREWANTTLGDAKSNLCRYFLLQKIVEPDGHEGKPLSLFALSTCILSQARRRLPPGVPQAVVSVALKGGAIPKGLLFEAVNRNRVERSVTRARAALVKMVLLSHSQSNSEGQMEQLDTKEHSPGYLCGRLMAVLENIQHAALPGVKATVRERFFGVASVSPRSVFPQLVRGAGPHLAKLRKERRGTFEALQRRIEEVMAPLPTFPKSLSLEEQGLFSLGYYHQRAADRAAAIAAIAAKEARDGERKGDIPNGECEPHG
ncbi:MAG TPA: type I-C CRISPR-associated protein Cas8c/Csd1 [Terriglobales bacterium]|nr:type I-C CRISPR-associated protein Cas8c/Csd1 [Terriglobales bacterium]